MRTPIIQLIDVVKTVPKMQQPLQLRQSAKVLFSQFFGHEYHTKHVPYVTILNGVSFEIYHGETVGIIGRNGAGKTSLLRLIAGIGRPTSGTCKVLEPVVAILGLTTSFDMPRTGYDNIYLMAAFYRTPLAQIRLIEQKIIDFSDLGDAIHEPVSTYSSGMIARLGISIVFHLMADVIILDEILAVGDIAFRQKCIDFIRVLAADKQTTLLLVSHSLESITQLCERAIWIADGQVAADGHASHIVEQYRQKMMSSEL